MGYAVAVLPASHHIEISELKRQFGDDVELATEHEIDELFQDCVRGAIPPSATATGSTWWSTTASMSSRRSISRVEITRPWSI